MRKVIFLLILMFAALFTEVISSQKKIKNLEQKVDELNFILKCEKR